MKTIYIQTILPNNITSRNSIHSIFKSIEQNEKAICLDFKGIDFISRSATDELLKIIKSNQWNVKYENMNDDIRSFLEIVQSTFESRSVDSKHIPFIHFTTESQISNFFANF